MAGELITQNKSEYNQSSFIGGMNLLGDDSRLQPTQYRAGFNLTNRYDVLDNVLSSAVDAAVPKGIIQEMVTFGTYIIIFVNGLAYYRYYLNIGWTPIVGFKMSSSAPRFWTVQIPVATTNYVRLSNATSNTISTPNAQGGINLLSVAGAGQGNLPGLLVQDGVSQPQFIFLDNSGNPQCRTTQTFAQWSITFTDQNNTKVATINGVLQDFREYVPIGTSMTWNNGILFITSPDSQSILRSVSGRPLDFVINVSNILAQNTTTQTWTYTDPITKIPVVVSVPAYTMSGGGSFTAGNVFQPGGDAYTTSYSVGVGGIVCLRALSTGGIFVAASNANFAVTLNTTPNAPMIFGEYGFLRTFLFNATLLSDRTIFDSVGDTRLIALTGIRSFNAVEQTQNEGKNLPFSAQIAAAFGSEDTPIVQNAAQCAAILFNDYELYACNTVFGPAICKWDTINGCWTSFDISQTQGKAVKIFAKIELQGVSRLFAVTVDNKLYTLYLGPGVDQSEFRTVGMCSGILYANVNVKMANPKMEIKPMTVRAILNKITQDTDCSVFAYVNNRLDPSTQNMTKEITYEAPSTVSSNPTDLPDTNTLLMNLLWSTPNVAQGWKMWLRFTWDQGSFTQFAVTMEDQTPMNPPNSQTLAQ